MKKIINILLVMSLLLVGCNSTNNKIVDNDNATTSTEKEYVENLNFDSLSDTELLTYVEDKVYTDLVENLNDDDYFVENVQAVYISKEYLDELSYNFKSNIFFGFTLDELNTQFDGSQFIFTLGDDGKTTVEEYKSDYDTYINVLNDVAIGTGVILLCVTVSTVTAGAGAPAVAMIFSASAKTATSFALSSGVFSGVSAGVMKGLETKDFDEALKAGMVAGGEAFKWGAITGAISGGVSEGTKYAQSMKNLKGITLNEGLTTQQAAAMQMESGYPVEVIKQFHSMDEYKVFKTAGLKVKMVNGQNALVRKNIKKELNLTDVVDDMGRTNLERMKNGVAPLDVNGKSLQLHHIGQESDATLAILTEAEHSEACLHGFKTISEIDRPLFATQRKNFWKEIAKMIEAGVI